MESLSKRFTIKNWCLFAVGTSKTRDEQLSMIRTISTAKSDEKIRNMRQLYHPYIDIPRG